MAFTSQHKISNGDILKDQGPRIPPQKGGKQLSKKTTTNKVSPSSSVGTDSADAVEGEDDEADSSAIEDQPSSDEEEADASALSGARQNGVAARQRPAGLKTNNNEDTTMNDGDDDDQTMAGAEEDATDGDDEDDYADIEDISDSEASDDEAFDESVVLKSAENDLIGEFERAEHRRDAVGMLDGLALEDEARDIAFAQHLSLQDREPQQDFDFGLNMDIDPFANQERPELFFNDMWDENEFKVAHNSEPGSPQERSGNATQKRVRFEEVQEDNESRASTPSDDDEIENTFPDLFASQDDPAIRHHLALDLNDDHTLMPYDFGDQESCYDFDG